MVSHVAWATSQVNGGGAVDYTSHVKPILAARCYSCHSALRQQSGLRLDTAALLLKGGHSGPAIVPGNSAESLLIEKITGVLGTRMPPEEDGAALSDEQISIIKQWIDQGAQAPPEPTPPDPRDHWAYQPPVRPDVPRVRNEPWVRNPIDAFLAAAHEAQGITPVGPADKVVLLRRVYLDLIGLPPSREELAAFLADDSPDAYERVVDRLLASPQYGERWARHWMDVWRYSDWSGYKEEHRYSARHIWRWRDWIIESLNADKGYDQMVREMLAGDEIAPTDRATLRATGFLARNWYKFNRNTWLEDTVQHTAKAFLALTMNCARCHDHKYDPISQEEYYQFRAIFEPHDVRTERVPGEQDILKDGVARACDLRQDVPTYVFERGDEKRPLKDHSVEPQVPQALRGALTVKAIELPLFAYYPALQEFAIAEDLAKAAQVVLEREQALAKARNDLVAAQQRGDEVDAAVAVAELAVKQLATARAAYAARAARIRAEKAKYGLLPSADGTHLAEKAARAERELALCQAQEQQFLAARELATATAALKPDEESTRQAVTSAEQKLATAQAAVAAAHAALAQPGTDYQPLGELLPRTSTGRRLALANWLTDRDNPLTARVAINHIWLRHFGAPLVENVFDFGLRSPAPRHQPLLDWLAVEFIDNGWRMKHIHRLMVTSAAYRMQSGVDEAQLDCIERDPDNRLFWRMNSRRMEAEVVRDAIFFTAGTLDLTRGGPDLDRQLALSTPRRSIYFRHAYEREVPFLKLFDGASTNECYRRGESIVPQQALALVNSETSLDQARLLAKKLSDLAANEPSPDEAFIRLAFQQILGRKPSTEELRACRTFLVSQAELLQQPSNLTPLVGGPKSNVAPAQDHHQRARENLTLVLYNHHDFVTIR